MDDLERMVGKSSNVIAEDCTQDYTLNLYGFWIKWYPTFKERAQKTMEIAKREQVDLIVGDETYDI